MIPHPGFPTTPAHPGRGLFLLYKQTMEVEL